MGSEQNYKTLGQLVGQGPVGGAWGRVPGAGSDQVKLFESQ